ncbi:hypothetical protein ACOSQ3_032436 [Xanthoceras sorbifolium]
MCDRDEGGGVAPESNATTGRDDGRDDRKIIKKISLSRKPFEKARRIERERPREEEGGGGKRKPKNAICPEENGIQVTGIPRQIRSREEVPAARRLQSHCIYWVVI